jgi:response regulator of citrate/malate metabolism
MADMRHAATRDAAHDILCRVRLDALILDCTIADEEVADLLDVMALRQPGARIIGLSAGEDAARDSRLLLDLIKGRAELGSIVTSVMQCLARAS